MIKRAIRKLIAGHLQWSLFGLVFALFVGFICSDYRFVVSGSPAADSEVSKVLAYPASMAPRLERDRAPAFAPRSHLIPKGGVVIPDTVNGVLVWPDPWHQITDPDLPFK